MKKVLLVLVALLTLVLIIFAMGGCNSSSGNKTGPTPTPTPMPDKYYIDKYDTDYTNVLDGVYETKGDLKGHFSGDSNIVANISSGFLVASVDPAASWAWFDWAVSNNQTVDVSAYSYFVMDVKGVKNAGFTNMKFCNGANGTGKASFELPLTTVFGGSNPYASIADDATVTVVIPLKPYVDKGVDFTTFGKIDIGPIANPGCSVAIDDEYFSKTDPTK